MSVTEPDFYDSAMAEEGAPSMLTLAESPWLPVYQEAARWIPSNHPVVDLGCGTGRFLAHLASTSHYGDRLGLDFSGAALAAARSYASRFGRFERADLRSWQPDPERPGNTTYVCLEVLEHLERDESLIQRIPPGHPFVFSVPNYESEAHARMFRSATEIVDRYGRWLDIHRWSLVDLGGGRAIHVCDSTRRIDSW